MLKFIFITLFLSLSTHATINNQNYISTLGLYDVEPSLSVLEDDGPIESPVKSPWKMPATQEYSDLAKHASGFAVYYVNRFFDNSFRNLNSYNRDMFKLGKKRFKNHYGKSSRHFKGYVLGAAGEHILSGTDCTRYIHKVWDKIIKTKFAKPNVTFPYVVTLLMHDIATAWDETLKKSKLTSYKKDLRNKAYNLYQKKLYRKWRALNKEAKDKKMPRLPKSWITKQLPFFDYYELVPNFSDAIPGDIVLKILNHTRYLERGHAYLFMAKDGAKAGIGAQSGEVGLAYNKHFSYKSRYVLRPNLDYIRGL